MKNRCFKNNHIFLFYVSFSYVLKILMISEPFPPLPFLTTYRLYYVFIVRSYAQLCVAGFFAALLGIFNFGVICVSFGSVERWKEWSQYEGEFFHHVAFRQWTSHKKVLNSTLSCSIEHALYAGTQIWKTFIHFIDYWF